MSKIHILSILFTVFVATSAEATSRSASDISEEEATVWCERDCSMEYSFFRRYARQGSSLASLSMAIMNYRGHGRDINVEAGNQLLLKAARGEEPAAMYQLGYFLLYGLYMERDLERSLSWFQRAAQHRFGNSEQMVKLVTQLTEGKSNDMVESVKAILANPASSSPGLYDQLPNNNKISNVERISVLHSFDWSHVLNVAKQQTCTIKKINCPQVWSFMLFPRIKSKNEEALLAAID